MSKLQDAIAQEIWQRYVVEGMRYSSFNWKSGIWASESQTWMDLRTIPRANTDHHLGAAKERRAMICINAQIAGWADCDAAGARRDRRSAHRVPLAVSLRPLCAQNPQNGDADLLK